MACVQVSGNTSMFSPYYNIAEMALCCSTLDVQKTSVAPPLQASNTMRYWRHITGIVLSIFGLMCLNLAFDQVIHPVLAILNTTGNVVDLASDPKSTPAAPLYQPVIRYSTTEGAVHTFTADFSQTDLAIPDPSIPPKYRMHIGDTVPIIYYPWSPDEASLGKVDKIIIIAVAFQWALLLGSGAFGFVALGIAGHLFYKGWLARRVPQS